MAEGFWEEWWDFLQKNWTWYLPIVATLVSPLIGSGASALYDYMKTKGWI